MANFNSIFFFTARESALDEYALLTLGMRDRHLPGNPHSAGDVMLGGKPEAFVREPICGPGTLARLRQHQAFAKLADGTCTESPVWLQPSFFDSRPVARTPAPDDLAQAVARLRETRKAVSAEGCGVPSFLLYMNRTGHPFTATPAMVAAVWQLRASKLSKAVLFPRFEQRIEGIEVLPSSWLVGLYNWILRNPSLAKTIVAVELRFGVLWPKLAPSGSCLGHGAYSVPESLNLFVYPSLWRPLSIRDRALVLSERPDLRQEVMSFPTMAEILK
jgi:hypothetical protein